VHNEILGKAPEAGDFSSFENFVLKVTLQSVKLLLTVNYRKMAKKDVLLAPPIILLWEQLLAPVPAPLSV